MRRRTLIKALSALTLTMCAMTMKAQDVHTADTAATDVEWGLLIKAISAVESSNNPKAVNGQHAGLLQISPVCVKECNNIVGRKKYTNRDRFNPVKSIEMFNLIQSRYNPERNIEKAARLWNGGPGWTKNPRRTNRYWRAVSRVLESLKDKTENK